MNYSSLKKLFNILIIIAVCLKVIVTQSINNNNDDSTCLNPYCACINFNDNITDLFCSNFDSFKQLDFTKTQDRKFRDVELFPKIDLDLNRDLNLSGLNLISNIATISFNRLKRVLVTYNPFEIISDNLNEIFIEDSQIEFVYDEILNSNEKLDCAKLLNKETIFSNLKLDEFGFFDVIFKNSKLCSTLFQNSYIYRFTYSMASVEDSFYLDTRDLNLNIDVKNLLVLNSFTPLNELKLLNQNVFKNVEKISFYYSQIDSIDENYFNQFKMLKSLFIGIDLKNLFNKNNSKWLKSLNSNINVDLSLTQSINSSYIRNNYFELSLFDRNETFSNELYCYFINLKHNQLVFTRFENFPEFLKCSCTVYWFYKYYQLYASANISLVNLPKQCLQVPDLEQRIENCNFEVRNKICLKQLVDNTNNKLNLIQIPNKIVFYFYFFFIFLTIKQVSF